MLFRLQTGEPLKGVSIQISALLHGQVWKQAALSGGDGSFSFQSLAPGSYSIFAEKTGYQPGGLAAPLPLEPNQSRTGIEIKLNRAAVITGRVTGADDLPVIGAEVAAYRHVWESGRRTVGRAESTNTDDRGVYRLYGLPAGRYFIAASPPLEESPRGELEMSSARTYYPNGTSAAEASVLNVRWGQELTGIDLVFRSQPTFSIAGLVADAEVGAACRACVVLAANLQEGQGFASRQFAVAPDGSYRIRGLAPGAYRITALKPTGGRHVIASRVVYLTDRSVRDVYLVVGVGHTVAGRVVFDPPPSASPKTDRKSTRLNSSHIQKSRMPSSA